MCIMDIGILVFLKTASLCRRLVCLVTNLRILKQKFFLNVGLV